MRSKTRASGIDIIGDIPWGAHFCQFYQTKEDLMDILIPYFKVGLENNEFCVWIISQYVDVREATEALKKDIPNFDDYLEKGQVEFIRYTDWCLKSNVFDLDKIINSWVEKLNQALASGYDGLRLTEDTLWLEKEDWNNYFKYVRKTNRVISSFQIVALRTYFVDKYNANETIDVINNHQFSLIKKERKWEQIRSSVLEYVTECKQSEEDMAKKAQLLDLSYDAILVRDAIDDRITYWNMGAQEVYGYTKEEALGHTPHELLRTEFPQPLEEIFKILYHDSCWTGELSHIRKDDRKITVVTRWALDRDEQGNPTSIMEANNDITERKEAEAKLKETLDNLEEKVKRNTAELEKAYISLREKERGLAEAQEIAHLGNWERNLDTNELHWSDEMYRVFGLKPQELEITFSTFLNCYVHPNDRDYVDNAVKRAFNGKPFSIDHKIITANGEERIVHTQGELIFDEKNTPVRIRGIVQDITERKRAEEALAKMEKIRIKEIHHRIKNNLQVISSLLDLQAETFSQLDTCRVPEVIDAFTESQNRVVSMALIHEELYKADRLDTLDFAAYLQKLAKALFSSYHVGSDSINLKLDLEQVYLVMDTAIPLGIIVNELVSNSLKHAFPNKRKGKISITLQKAKNFAITRGRHKPDHICMEKGNYLHVLTIVDNGKGIPEEINLQNTDSLGFQLVNLLVEQIDGYIELKRDEGTEFTIWFNNIEK
jgi:PAS domain S-box-containing protein